jgi:hypothetical protein
MGVLTEYLIRIKGHINSRWTSARRWVNSRVPAPPVIADDSRSSLVQSLDFNEHVRRIKSLLESLPGTSPKVLDAVKALRAYSAKPLVEIVAGSVWAVESDLLIVKTHLKSEFQDAVERMTSHGRILSSDDRNYLRLILTHTCGWSPSAKEHSHDAWMSYLQAEYSHLENLQCILDSFTWQEDIAAYPAGLDPPEPWLFLLATSDAFYIYDFENRCMCRVGVSLKEVYMGLKETRYRGNKEGDWEEESRSLEIDPCNYFPVYIRSREGELILQFPLKEFEFIS